MSHPDGAIAVVATFVFGWAVSAIALIVFTIKKKSNTEPEESELKISDSILRAVSESICCQIRKLDDDVGLWSSPDNEYLSSYIKTREALYGQYMAVNEQRRGLASRGAATALAKEPAFSEL